MGPIRIDRRVKVFAFARMARVIRPLSELPMTPLLKKSVSLRKQFDNFARKALTV